MELLHFDGDFTVQFTPSALSLSVLHQSSALIFTVQYLPPLPLNPKAYSKCPLMTAACHYILNYD